VVPPCRRLASRVQQVLASPSPPRILRRRPPKPPIAGVTWSRKHWRPSVASRDSSKGVAASIATLGSQFTTDQHDLRRNDDIGGSNQPARAQRLRLKRRAQENKAVALPSSPMKCENLPSEPPSDQGDRGNRGRDPDRNQPRTHAMDQGTPRRKPPEWRKTSASGEALQEIIQMSAKVANVISEITAAANQQSDQLSR